MKVLIVNCGSSSLKYQLFDMTSEKTLAKGLAERIGTPKAVFHHHRWADGAWKETVLPGDVPDHKAAARRMVDALTAKETGCLASIKEIQAVGHRVVHGGPRYNRPVLADDAVIEDIETYAMYAPLHNPANALGIRVLREAVPDAPQVAVFDTAFHQTLPPHAYLYGINFELAEKYGIRRYGFHGLSHHYVAERAAILMGKPLMTLRLVTCHVGSGTSVCAVDRGRSVETSMGMTPLQGVIMGTRSGSLDPSIVELLMEKEKLDFQGIVELLNRRSGLLGLSGVSADIRDLEKAAKEGNLRAQLALDVHVHQIKKFIGSYIFVMGGTDGIVFTAGVGENSARFRAEVCKHLEFLGGRLDEAKNRDAAGECLVNAADSKVKIAVIPTNEELMIARATVGGA